MSRRHALRLGAATAVSGGLLTLVGNLFHPRLPGQLDSATNLFNVVVHHDSWAIDHLVITIGIALLLHGFSGVTRSIQTERGAAWARFAWHMAIVGTFFGLALMLTEAVAVTSLAHAWHSSSGEEQDLLLAAGNAVFELSLTFSVGGMLFLFGAAPLLYGTAMIKSTEYRHWIGWVGVFFSTLAIAAAGIQVTTGESALAFYVLFPIAAIGITLWMIGLGVLMWRMSAK